MALVSGVESWGTGSPHLAKLACGLAVVTVGAATLGRSEAVSRVSGTDAAYRRPDAGTRPASQQKEIHGL